MQLEYTTFCFDLQDNIVIMSKIGEKAGAREHKKSDAPCWGHRFLVPVVGLEPISEMAKRLQYLVFEPLRFDCVAFRVILNPLMEEGLRGAGPLLLAYGFKK